MNITPEQLEQHKASLALCTAEIALQERELETWKARGEAERNLYSWIADCTIDPGQKRTPLRAFHDAHKAHYAAEADLKTIALVKLKSQCAILTALVQEAERMIKEPDRKLVVS